MISKDILKIAIHSFGAFVTGQVFSIVAGVLWVLLSSDDSFGAGLSGILVYLVVSIICTTIGIVIVIVLNKDRIRSAIVINFILAILCSFLVVFLLLGSPLTKNDVSDREVTARGETTISEYENNTGFELPEDYSNLELECESGLDYACTLSFEMSEDKVNEYVKQFGFTNGVDDLQEYDSDELSKQYIIYDGWNFDGYSLFLKGETALTEVVDGVEYAGMGTKIIIAYKNPDSPQIKVYLFHID